MAMGVSSARNRERKNSENTNNAGGSGYLWRIRMRRILNIVLNGFVISLLSCSSIWAQATAQISGTVKDQSGAVLPGVEVTATQTDTGIARSAVTNETGSFVLPNLAIGPYRLEASLPG